MRRFSLVKALLAGDPQLGAALAAALRDRDVDAEFLAPGDEGSAQSVGEGLVEIERRLEADRPAIAVGMGPGYAAIALAITASKAGVPFCAVLDDGDDQPDERRMLEALSAFDAGSEAAESAELIAARLRGSHT